MFDVRT